MSLVVSVLGPFQATYDGQSLIFATDATRALLAYLAIEGDRPHSRAQLAALLWPEQPQPAAYANLRQTLARLRRALPEPAAGLLLVTSQTLQLARGEISIDQTHFEELLAECAAHAHAQPLACLACAERLRAAADLYRGELLRGLELADSQPFEEWLLVRREALHRQALDTLHTLTRQAESSADYIQMRDYAARQLALEPWREEAHTQLMLALAYSGQRTAALAQYETCRRVLDQELGIEPEVATQLLYTRIRDGALVPAALGAQLPAQNLPAQLTPFVGRERELAEIAAQLQQPDLRLLTLIGAGGMGKTRLAIEAARARLDDFRNGVFFVALAPLTAASAIAAAIAVAVGVSIGGDPEQALLHALRDKHMLLIFDNFEHLLGGAALVAALLQAAPQIQLLATSREALNLRGEHLYRVRPMEDAADATLADTATSSALRLFTQSARRSQPDFVLGAANLASVQRICALVQGMPLGLELAAAWAGSLELDEIAEEIMHSADFLTSEWRDAPERQRSMRAVFDWSWRLLNQAEQVVFRQLAVFRGGFTRAAAEAVLGASLQLLTRLLHKSLLHRGAAGRYEVHELLRQFAAEQLAIAPNEQAAVAARHSHFYLNFLAQRELRLARSEPREATAEIGVEIDNIRQAWAWAIQAGQIIELSQSAIALRRAFLLMGLFAEAEHAFRLAAEQIETQIRPATLAANDLQQRQQIASKLRGLQGRMLSALAHYDQAIIVGRQAIALGQASAGIEGEILGYLVVGQWLARQGHDPDAQVAFEHALKLALGGSLGDRTTDRVLEVEGDVGIWLGAIALRRNDYAAAFTHYERSLQIYHTLGDLRGETLSLCNLGAFNLYRNKLSAACQRYEQALQLSRVQHYIWGEGITQLELGFVARRMGEYDLARELTERALTIFQDTADDLQSANAVTALGWLHMAIGSYGRAKEWLDASSHAVQDITTLDARVERLFVLSRLAQLTNDYQQALLYAQDARQRAEAAEHRLFTANALLLIGQARTQLGQPADAEMAYRQALAIYEQLNTPFLAAEAHAGLAWLALEQGYPIQALESAKILLNVLADDPYAGLEEPFSLDLICYRVLAALADPRAPDVLRIAQQRLLDYSNRIGDADMRRSFLENVSTHRELLSAGTPIHLTR